MTALFSGFCLPLEGGRLLMRERRLWGLTVVPIVISLAAFLTAIASIVGFSEEIYSGATGWMPALEAGRWYAWLWIGPARLLLGLLGAALFLAIAGVGLVAAFLVASLLASPFHDALSLRVERIVTGCVVDAQATGALDTLRDAARALREEARRTLFFLGVTGTLAGLGFVIPGAQILAGPAILVFTIFFLPLDYAGFALDRRRLSFKARRRWLLAHRDAALGFGGAAFLACLVPGINLLAMPILVAGGTLLALRYPPEPEGAAAAR